MEARPLMAMGHARTDFARKKNRKTWTEIADTLNTDPSGCTKTPEQWCKYWKDKKASVKRKINLISAARRNNENAEIELSQTEKRILVLLRSKNVTLKKKIKVDCKDQTDTLNENSLQANIIKTDPLENDDNYLTHSPMAEEGMSPPSEDIDLEPGLSECFTMDTGHTSSTPLRQSGPHHDLLRRSLPLQSQPENLTERLISIEEKRAEAELITARSRELNAQTQQTIATSITQVAHALCTLIEVISHKGFNNSRNN